MLYFDIYRKATKSEDINPEKVRLYIPEHWDDCEKLDYNNCYYYKLKLECPQFLEFQNCRYDCGRNIGK